MLNKEEERRERGEDPKNIAIGDTYSNDFINQRTGFPNFDLLKELSKKQIEKKNND